MSDENVLKHEESSHRFVVRREGHTAKLLYRRSGETIHLVHTQVPAEMEGPGAGSRLVQAALEYAQTLGLRVIPDCPFAASFIKRHPEYQDLT